MTNKKDSEWDRYPAGISPTREAAIAAARRKADRVAEAFRTRKPLLQIETKSLGNKFLWRISRKPR